MFSGRRQPSYGGTSRMTRECQVRICERLGVKFPGSTRPGCVKSRKFNLRVELPSRFCRLKTNSASKQRREKAIEKTIPPISGQRDFSHTLGHNR